MTIRVSATGDSMLLMPFPPDYACGGIAEAIADCDVRLTNLEEVLSRWDCCASTYCGGQWINAEPERLSDLMQYGFNMFSCANNHSMDYSYDGLASTMRALRQADVPFAGVGESLDEASRPCVLELPSGKRVAMLSATSTFIDAARAGNARETIPARPGINPLRVKTKYLVTREHFDQLSEIAAATYINGERDNARKIGSLPPEIEGSLNFGGHFFCVTDDGVEGKCTSCDPRDLTRIVAEVRKAAECADLVLVSVHSHQILRGSYQEPDQFLEEFAHAVIDAGAHAVIGGGTHQLKPVEVYCGKPIFYSLGNFIFESGMIPHLPADYWDKYRFDPALSVAEAQRIKTKGGTIGLETDVENYLSVVPRMAFDDDGCLISLDMVPVELGFSRERAYKGLPVRADAQVSQQIFERLCKLSEPYGTKMELSGDAIVVRVGECD